MLRALKDLRLQCFDIKRCGDGCCSWKELDGNYSDIKIGEEFEEDDYDISGLEEKIDYA